MVMQAAWDKLSIQFQGYDVQIFADLAPATILKWREIKAVLQILQKH